MAVYLGNGAVLSLVYTASSTTVASTVIVGGVRSIEGPDAERETVDITLLNSTAAWQNFTVGDGDPGTLTITVAYDNQDGTQIAVNEMMSRSTAVTVNIAYNSASLDTDTFSGFVIGRGRTIERNGIIEGPLTIKLSSSPGFATTT